MSVYSLTEITSAQLMCTSSAETGNSNRYCGKEAGSSSEILRCGARK